MCLVGPLCKYQMEKLIPYRFEQERQEIGNYARGLAKRAPRLYGLLQ